MPHQVYAVRPLLSRQISGAVNGSSGTARNKRSRSSSLSNILLRHYISSCNLSTLSIVLEIDKKQGLGVGWSFIFFPGRRALPMTHRKQQQEQLGHDTINKNKNKQSSTDKDQNKNHNKNKHKHKNKNSHQNKNSKKKKKNKKKKKKKKMNKDKSKRAREPESQRAREPESQRAREPDAHGEHAGGCCALQAPDLVLRRASPSPPPPPPCRSR